VPSRTQRWRAGGRALAYHLFNLLFAAALAVGEWIPAPIPVAFALMLADAVEGVARPAVGARPVSIGVRQLAASTLFVALVARSYLAG
jgi:hypothetical protein